MNTVISKKIKELRLEKGLTQPELAKALSVSNGMISFWENEINEPKASNIYAIAKFFNVTSDYLLGLDIDDTYIFENNRMETNPDKSKK